MGIAGVTSEEKRFLKKVGARVRALRAEKGWTLEETEDHGWNDWTHLQKIESGKNITLVTLKRVAQLYRIPVSKILEAL